LTHNSDLLHLSKLDTDPRHGFPLAEQEDWEAAARKLLRKPIAEAGLSTATSEGIQLEPIYHPGSIRPVVVPVVGADWLIAQALPQSDPGSLNQALKHDLLNGQSCINLALDPVTRWRGKLENEAACHGTGGVRLKSADDWGQLLQGIDLTTPLYLQAYTAGLPLTSFLLEHAVTNEIDFARLQGAIENDPLGELAISGTLPCSLEQSSDEIAIITGWAIENASAMRTIAVHTEMYHNAGGSAVTDLAYALATGVEQLRQLQERGLQPVTTAPHFLFSFAVGPDFFMEIAKLRAARLLWQQVLQSCGCDTNEAVPHLRAVTAEWNLTATEQHVNILRLTTSSLAAVLGGCDSLQTGFFDIANGDESGELARRLARNTQLVLQEEVNLGRVQDPAAGSYLVEQLTGELCEKSWHLFQEIEKRGGMTAVLLDGFPQQELQKLAEQKREKIARGDYHLVGTTIHINGVEEQSQVKSVQPDSAQKRKPILAEPITPRRTDEDSLDFCRRAVRAGASLSQLDDALHVNGDKPLIEPLRPFREILSELEVKQ
jgi:methylmalonyl-CoA mutase